MTINDHSFEIIPLTLAELHADESGRTIEQLAELIGEVFSESLGMNIFRLQESILAWASI